jgi:transcriptional regulator with XRE-family HTH domain
VARGIGTSITPFPAGSPKFSQKPWVDNIVNPGYIGSMDGFGSILRELRQRTGVGIKRLAPELGVSYSYLSKLENSEVGPSEELVGKVAKYFEYDRDRLLIAAGKIPPEILRILQDHPDEALDFLRTRFGRVHK